MTDPQLLSSTLEAIDRLVADRRGATSASATMGIGREPVRLVVDEGRAAAEWTLTVPRAGVATELAIVVVCDVADGRLTAARLYSAIPVKPRPGDIP